MMMPFMDGPATIRALQRLNPHVKIVAASGLGANEKAAEAASAGVQTFLAKPYTAEKCYGRWRKYCTRVSIPFDNTR